MATVMMVRIALSALILGLGASESILAQPNSCRQLPKVGYGPFDYRTQRKMGELVEQYHFTPQVEALIGGATGHIGQDLEYTLDRIPNHHRALTSLMRLAARDKRVQIPHMNHRVDCYFERALVFASDDTITRTLYALHLSGTARRDEAIRQLDVASEHAGDNPFSHFSIGLVYFDVKAYDKAAERAVRARALGLPRSELIDRLKEVGRWGSDAAESTASTASSASSR